MDKRADLHIKRIMTLLSHLSLFATSRSTGSPITRLPFYAEIGVPALAEPVPVVLDQRFQEAIIGALQNVDAACAGNPACRSKVLAAMSDVLARLLAQETRDNLAADLPRAGELIEDTLKDARTSAGQPLGSVAPQALTNFLEKALARIAAILHVPLVAQPPADKAVLWAYPLGVLATDHVGYLSFDLARLPVSVLNAVAADVQARKADPAAVLNTVVRLYPLIPGADPIDALSQGRFAENAILAKVELDDPDLPVSLQNLGMLAMQNPDLSDWRISPASFAVNPGTLVGQDGCESLLPANVALQEFYFYQVVRLNDVSLQRLVPVEPKGKVRVGLIHEYRLAWFPLGHSLGQIQYSLPLAPGESVNLAVIDWTRRDDAQRAEHTTMDEQLVHNEHRDRTITETVDAAIQEYQKGSSFMGGLAESVGASGSFGGMLGAAAGTAWSLGGSTANSSGSRNIAANTVQKINDNISQASASKRELQSTVVVHSVQAEKEAIETRTIVNYNHSHALTILYYEVLRHFRVVTERVRSTAALLVQYDVQPFFVTVPIPPPAGGSTRVDTGLLGANRAALKAGLLDSKFSVAFDALERNEQRAKVRANSPKVPPYDPGNRTFAYFRFEMLSGGWIADYEHHGEQRIHVNARIGRHPGGIKMVGLKDGSEDDVNPGGAFLFADAQNTFYGVLPAGTPPVPWSQISVIELAILAANCNASFKHIKITGIDAAGSEQVLVDQGYESGHLLIREPTNVALPTSRPPAPAPPSGPSPEEINDQSAVDELLDHLQQHKEYYNRLIWLSEDPLVRASRFDNDPYKWDATSTLLDHLDNRAVEIVSSWVAFPTSDKGIDDAVVQALKADLAANPQEPDRILNERLVTLPTRGVFAEAKLGHCNASEEIDNTRFWDWQKSPIPHLAPEIAPVTPVTPAPQQQNLQPTAFPQSLVNIVNPPSEPDPTGLAAALNLLATPNIFRDMSGQAQVEDLLKKLSDNSISIAQAANMARQIQQNRAAGSSGSAPSASTAAGALAGSSGFGARATPTQPSAAVRDLGDFRQELGQGVAQGRITPEDANAKYTQAADRLTSGPMLGFALDGGVTPSLNPGNFKPYLDAGRLDPEVADVLRELDGFPADSWAKQTAAFIFHELQVGNLYGIFDVGRGANITYLKSQIPTSFHSNLNFEVNRITSGRATAITTPIGTPGAYKGYTLLEDSLVTGAATPGATRNRLMIILAHELTHFRNRDIYIPIDKSSPNDATLYIDTAKALARTDTQRLASQFMQEVICKHVAWRVQQDLNARATGAVVRPNPDKKGFYQGVLDQSGAVTDNGYLADIGSDYNKQAAWWMRRAGQISLFHDDPTRNTAVRQFFEDTYNDVQPAFTTPAVVRDGIV